VSFAKKCTKSDLAPYLSRRTDMKYFFPAIATILGFCFIPTSTVCAAPDGADSGLYQWTDESGTVNFSDNSRNIPAKYEKGVKIRDSMKAESAPGQAQNKVTEKTQPATQAVPLYGGHDEKWWCSRFADLNAKIRTIKGTLSEEKEKLKKAHFKKVISSSIGQPTLLAGNPRKNRAAYQELYNKIKADEERAAALEKELEALDIEASSVSVPPDWKK
jgi:hypothetical protein